MPSLGAGGNARKRRLKVPKARNRRLKAPKASEKGAESICGAAVGGEVQVEVEVEAERVPEVARQRTLEAGNRAELLELPDPEGARSDAEEADGSGSMPKADREGRAEGRPEPRAKRGRESDRPGVLHLPSLPPMMHADKLRHLMEQFGQVGRVFLAPEDKSLRQARKRAGRSRKLRFTEGWVEFARRRVARRVAEALNGRPVGGRKRHNFYRDALWNLRYLKGFKWYQIKERSMYDRQVRKLRLERMVSRARRETDFFLENRDRACLHQQIEKRKAARKERVLAEEQTSRAAVK